MLLISKRTFSMLLFPPSKCSEFKQFSSAQYSGKLVKRYPACISLAIKTGFPIKQSRSDIRQRLQTVEPS